jgi:peptidoglycan/xylan/chitin deacetylase (PgdA/CDA1 family)
MFRTNIKIKISALAGILLLGLCTTNMSFATEQSNSSPLIVLMLHHFTTDPLATNNATIEMNTLEYKLIAYQNAGYQFVRLGEEHTVKKPIVITIDDGYESVYTRFYPVAKRMNIPFNLNLIMSRIGTHSEQEIPKCSLDQLLEMKASGLCQLGVHSYNAHGMGQREGLVKLPNESWSQYQEAIHNDTKQAIALYQQYFNEVPTIYAYPYGTFSDYTHKMLIEYGFKYTLTTMYGVNSTEEHYTLRRLNVNMYHVPMLSPSAPK